MDGWMDGNMTLTALIKPGGYSQRGWWEELALVQGWLKGSAPGDIEGPSFI